MTPPPGDFVAGVRAELAAQLHIPESGSGPPLAVVCDACVRLLPIDGASVAIAAGPDTREMLYASDETAAHIEALQDTLHEGPGLDASAHRRPVLAADLAADAAPAWPVFAVEIARRPVGALFAFPLQSGAAVLGTICLYRRAPGWLTPDDLALALQLVDLATIALLTYTDGGLGEQTLTLPPRRQAVHQAVGMLIAEHRIPAAEALARLRGYAFATGTSVEEVAAELTGRRLHPRAIFE